MPQRGPRPAAAECDDQTIDGDWCPAGWDRRSFAHDGHSHAFYVVDHSPPEAPRPSVMLMHEFPGISCNLVALADVLAEDFRVVIPSIVGRDGSAKALDSLRRICVRREVHILSRHGVSDSVGWLRDFADAHVAGPSDRRFGVIGLCLTGNFALALAVDHRVAAAVVGEPAIPIRPSGLGLSADDRTDLSQHPDLRVQGYRFRYDCTSPAAKLTAAQKLLGPERMRMFTLTSPNLLAHSTLTGRWASEAAIESTRAFLNERLA